MLHSKVFDGSLDCQFRIFSGFKVREPWGEGWKMEHLIRLPMQGCTNNPLGSSGFLCVRQEAQKDVVAHSLENDWDVQASGSTAQRLHRGFQNRVCPGFRV